jgi:hypothetical protein
MQFGLLLALYLGAWRQPWLRVWEVSAARLSARLVLWCIQVSLDWISYG